MHQQKQRLMVVTSKTEYSTTNRLCQMHGNQYRVQGLERALNKVERYCTQKRLLKIPA